MSRKPILIWALMLLLCLYAKAQNNLYQFAQLDINNGLSNNQINCIFKDQSGFMWFGTTSGLNRFDGYKFRVYKNNYHDHYSIGDNYVGSIYEGPGKKMWVFTHNYFSIYDPETEKFSNNVNQELSKFNIITNDLRSIKKDKSGNFWFLTNDNGLFCYNSRINQTVVYSRSSRSIVKLHSNLVSDITDCGNGIYWIIYTDGTLEQMDNKAKRIIATTQVPSLSSNLSANFSLIIDCYKNLWIWAGGSQLGVYNYNVSAKTYKHFAREHGDIVIKSNIINNIVVDDDNKVWIGTDHGGINIADPKTLQMTYLLSRENDPKSLSGNSVILYKSNDGIIWAGTYKQGISYYHKGIYQFPIVKHVGSDPTTLPYEDVDCFKEDKHGNLWIGTNGGGLICYNAASKKYTRYTHDAADPGSISNDVVISLCIDHEGKLWVGTYFGGLNCFDGQRFQHFRQNDKVPGSLSDDRVYSIFEDKDFNIWVGTFAGGISVYNRATGRFSTPPYKISSTYVPVLYPDGDQIWAGEDKGIDLINTKTGQVKHYAHDVNKPESSLAANDVNSVTKDSRGLMWFGTKGGLSILDPRTGKFTNLYEDKNLLANNILDILEDKQGRMWLSSTNGVALITLSGRPGHYNFGIKNFDVSDGLQGREFNVKAAYKTPKGKMIFGGAHGFNLFDPQQIHTPSTKPPLIFTDLQLFNKSLAVGDTVKGSVVLNKAISVTPSVVFNHNQDMFSLEFASCDFFNARKIQYQYQLEGFDKGWLNASPNTRRATYTNLDAGNYVFKVRAFNSNNATNASTIRLNITVKPPFWKSPLAYLLYGILFIAALFYLRHRGIRKLKKEFAQQQLQLEKERKIEAERAEARRMHELDLMKIKFFTNVSHEFRTPLSLILSPIEQLIKSNHTPEQQQQLVTIKKNGKRLLNLVNQLLDFRKMEFNELKLSQSKGDMVAFVKEASASFTDIAQKKGITYVIESEVECLITSFDHDKLERILFNLLSNAFKFTPAGGHICVLLNLSEQESAARQIFEIKVIDTGIGISAAKQEKIFERFFQDDLPQNLLNQGSGIGLSITREFVKMHGGTIEVESEPGQGSCFTISIPVVAEAFTEQQVVSEIASEPKKAKEQAVDISKKPLVLLIEDNDDLRFYLKDNLKQHFQITEACNGKEGWQKALGMQPNLIVSDISMPEMNGVDLCRKIKNDIRTTHIPVVLLTAMCEQEDQLIGLESGANDYIVKPFNFEILLSKIQNLLALQDTLRKTYQKHVDVSVDEMNIESEDEKFIRNAIRSVEENITNPNFSVEELSRLMLLSRVSLYKKLLTLTGKTPVDFIRSIRLQKAVQLLDKSKLNIASVAYEVGFSNPTYFAKVFKEEYGMLPSDYVNKLRKSQTNLQDSAA